MKNFYKRLFQLVVTCSVSISSIAQTTETFEDDVVGATTFTDNGQTFTITNGPGETNYDIETFTGGGWNGTSPDNNFVDNSGVPNPALGNGSSFTIATSGSTDIYVNNMYLFMSQFNLTAASGFSLTIQGRKNGVLQYTIVKSSGFSNTTTFTPNNGFTFINFATEGGSDNSNTAVDELLISTTGNADYIALDAMNWEFAPVCTSPSVPSITATPATICSGSSSTLSWTGALNDATQWAVYSGSCGGTLLGTTATSTFVVSPGFNTTYFIRGEGGCVVPGSCGTVSVTVNALDNASFNYSAATYCSNASDPTPTITGLAGGTFSSTAGLALNAGTGTVDVSASTPGTYTVTYTTAGSCPNSSNASVTINALDNASFNYSAASYCVNTSDPTPTITGLAGGTFISGAGLAINASTGVIDVSASTPGTYTVTYTTSGACPNSSNVSVTVNALDNASFNYSAAAYCSNGSDPTPTITGLAGGTFSSTAGIALNAGTGTVDVSASTPGTYTVTYTTSGSCPNSSNVSVIVNAVDNASFNYSSASYCVAASDPTPTITGVAGGTFTSGAGLAINASTGVIDVSASTPGTYTVTYTTSGACPNSSAVSVTINSLDDASFNYSAAAYCSNASDPTPSITGVAGGTFTSGAGLAINASTGVIDVSASTPGTYTVTYTTSGACSNSSNVSVTLNALDNASFNYSAAAYCVNDSDPTPTVTGLAGGTFSSTAGLSINASTGAIDVSAATPGTYTVTYTTAGTCPNSSNVSVTINALDNASFSYNAASYCLGDSDPTPTITGLAGGTFSSSPAGLNINASTGFVNIGLSAPGSYTVTYTTAGTCPNSSNASLTIGNPPATPTAVSPMTVCPGTNVILSATGSGTGSLVFYDNVPSVIGTVPMPPATGTFNAGALAAGSYTFGVTESNGTCQSLPATINVTVEDVTPPTAVCQNISAFLDGAGNTTIVAADLDGGSSDNCGAVTLSASQTAFTCANIGANNVTLTVTDASGNTANCTAVVTVLDTISPVTLCPGNQIETPDAACNFTLPDYTGLVTATDNCSGSPVITQSPAPGTVISGTTTITMTANDGNGNTSFCTFNVTLVDATPPTAVCQNINVYLDGAGNASIVAADIDGGSADNCSGLTLNASQTTFTCADIGANNVTLTATDGNANSSNCSAVVTVLDTVSPIADIASLVDLTDECGITSLTAPTASDNCAGTITGTHGATLPITSTTTITWTYDDGNGNASTQTQAVIINDVTAPVADVATLADLTDECEITALTAPTATDNCVGSVTATNNAALPITSSTTITWTYDDGSGNISTQTQEVIINDVTAPVADVASLSDVIADCEVTSLTAPTATDNCLGSIVGTHTATLPINAQGTTTITWTYDDGNGNTSTQTQDVVITDATAPAADVANLSDINSECEVTPTAPTAADNCAGAITGTPDVSFPITATGTTTVTWTYDDGNGNTSTQTQDVVITTIDNSVTVVNDITLSADASGYTYQWVDCNDNNSPIAGETNQTFEATANGSYSVIIDNGDCSVTSDCFDITTVGLDNNELIEINVYPNPTSGVVNIESSTKIESIELMNALGQIIGMYSANQETIEINGERGVYFLKITAEGHERVVRVVKH